jgi:molybdopterin-guanine dinucleotide biosynthesis protein
MGVGDIEVVVNGKEHSGKTSLIALIAKALEEYGLEVRLQRIDPQLDDKLENPEAAIARLKGQKIFIREYQTAG